ncbi:hypothetical protein [Cupriavidus sp. 8B]
MNLRYMASDGHGNCSFYDLEQNRRTRSQKFTIERESKVIPLLGKDITLSADSWRDSLPDESELSDERKEARAARWNKVERVFRRNSKEPEDSPVFTDDIYFSSSLFRKMMRQEAKRQGLESASGLYVLFWTCITYGVDEYALTDHFNACGAPDMPRSTREEGEKTGRKSAGFFRDPETYTADNRFGRFWRRRTISAIVTSIACDPRSARNLFNSAAQFGDLMLGGFCFAGGDLSVRERRKIPAAQIPERRTLGRQGMNIVRGLAAEISPLLSWAANSPAGSSTDIALGDEIIADMDVTDFKYFRIAFVTDDESEMRDLGVPRVALGVVRGSDYLLGYYPTIGYERTDVYLYCALSMLTNKTARLKELGFNEPLAGMESGTVDGIFADGGPGSSKRAKVFTLRDLKVDHVKAPPYYPQGKGNVEGSNYRLKGRVYSNLHLAEDVIEAVLNRIGEMPVEQRLSLRHGQGLSPALKRREKEGIIYLRERVFEQVLVEAINEHNLAVLTQKSALTQKMLARRHAPTRIEAFREQMEARRGDRAYERTETEIRKAILMSMKMTAKVKQGLVNVKEGQYGGKDNMNHENVKTLMEWERAQRLKENLNDRKAVNIEVTPAPHGNVLLWHLEGREPLALPPTKAFCRRVGADADRTRVVALHQWAHVDIANERKKQADEKTSRVKRYSKEAMAESDRIKRSRGFDPTAPARPRSPAARTHRRNEEQEQFERNAAASGVEPAMAPSTVFNDESYFAKGLDENPYNLSDLQKHLRRSSK